MKAVRLTCFTLAAVALWAAAPEAAPLFDPNAPAAPETTSKPAAKKPAVKPAADKSAKPAKRPEKSADTANKADGISKPDKAKQPPKAAATATPLGAPARPVAATSSVPPAGAIGRAGPDAPRPAYTPSSVPLRPSVVAAPPPPARRWPAFAMAASAATSPLDLSAIKQGLELAHKGRSDEATNVQSSISDPLGRKLLGLDPWG